MDFVIFLGEDELNNKVLNIKSMSTGNQVMYNLDDTISIIKFIKEGKEI